MTDHQMIFSAPMIRALLDGRKTMTRRLLKTQMYGGTWIDEAVEQFRHDGDGERAITRFSVGDLIWCREKFSIYLYRPGCWYWADGRVAEWDATRPLPAVHMSRWASRLTLIVTAVEIERLQDISEEDAKAEGAPYDDGPQFPVQKAPAGSNYIEDGWESATEWYADLWDSLHGDDAWGVNPYVDAISFRTILANIDQLEA